jgi:hypothetical protein
VPEGNSTRCIGAMTTHLHKERTLPIMYLIMYMSKQHLVCCICATSFRSTVRNTISGYFKEAACSRACLDEKQWRETLSIMGKDYYPRDKKTNED